ncbi:MAG: LytTR family transcriptional regulator DNA-binding domain-containing protein [Clostridiales bacterium]|jgi:DNA-binding LytR/AlgR family response regulator|nr:LytTR family transcriptional regulator DNA-binding domain-containing protein [Clostridiales bacterium]MDR2750925.1 LytTR family transcriptional regulator DNA-binding domain-containing protein [Clostridiales bacterium]
MLCYICDSTADDCREMARLYKKYAGDPLWKVKAFMNPEKLMNLVVSDKPEIMIIDISLKPLGEGGGVDLAKKVLAVSPATKIIFVGDDPLHCTAAYGVKHEYFMPRALCAKTFPIALGKAIEASQIEGQAAIIVKTRDILARVFYDEILYIENHGRQVLVHVVKGPTMCSYASIENLMEILDDRFLRCSKSYIVNMDRVKSLSRRELTMRNGDQVHISQSHFARAKRVLSSYLEARALVVGMGRLESRHRAALKEMGIDPESAGDPNSHETKSK